MGAPAAAPGPGREVLLRRLEAAEARSDALEHALDDLRGRVEALEARRAPEPDARPGTAEARAPLSRADGAGSGEPSRPPGPAAELSVADLVAAGIPVDRAQRVREIADRVAMERLRLEDRAGREGWLGSGRYAAELGEINRQVEAAREELGPDAYDHLLYASGRPNRVAVRSVIAGSAAEAAGILPGDRVLRYAGDAVFDGEALRAATRAGDPGATIPVELERDGSTLLLYLPRGPIGIRMGFVRERP
jgi:hypothetical protein